jgi:flagellar biosynthesis GTPase FlhF
MILKNIFGKTIEAAKKSAQQMYGDDILVIESAEATEENGKARITIFSDGKKEAFKNGHQKADQPKKQPDVAPSAGVKFERTTSPNGTRTNGSSTRLASLRKYAEELSGDEGAAKNGFSFQKPVQNGSLKEEASSPEKEKPSDTVYSRSLIRNMQPKNSAVSNSHSAAPQEDAPEQASEEKTTAEAQPAQKKFITHFKETKKAEPKADVLPASPSPRQEQREINALHKRFDKLEALLDSALISANIDYASHPAFQQLVHTGINTSVIAGWFSQIIEEGIDPYDQNELFMSKLAGIIRKALGQVSTEDPQKFMLFAGASGAGKTSLIMKLCTHPSLLGDKNIAVVSVHPQNKKEAAYYTILKPFCRANDIPYFEIKDGLEITKNMKAWEEYDHVLIDSPSLSTAHNNSFREFWKIRQLLSPLTPLEVHYVVNASMSPNYFRNSSAIHHPLQPDFVAITHLDEVTQWGPIIPFLQDMGCTARYISRGNSVPNSLIEFNPQWFAQKVLQEI